MTYEKVKMGKTGFRRQLDKEVRAKVLLSEASLWQIIKHMIKKYNQQLFWVGFILGWTLVFILYFGKH